MQVVDRLKMFSIAVSDIPKAKASYEDTPGLKVTKDYREDDDNWWVTLNFPGGRASIALAKAEKCGYHEHIKPGTLGGTL